VSSKQVAWRTRQRRLQASAWRVPTVYAVGALAAGFIIPRLEVHLLPALQSPINTSAAMAMYSAIASGMLSMTAIVFSLTFVMVQFSATAYSPRLVLWLARDPLISHALGVFMATFLYALASLAWVERGSNGVLLLSVLVVLALVLASVAVFIGLIQRIALLQINRMLTFTGDCGRDVIDALYPPWEAPDPALRVDAPADYGAPTQILTHHGRPRVLQAVHIESLVGLADASGAVIEMVAAVGDTLTESARVLHVMGGRFPVDERRLKDAFELGDERTFDQDPKYALRILVDIAIKALSPAVNDPTTAVQVLDQIGDLLIRLGRRRLEIGTIRGESGEVRVLVPFPSWEDFLRLAFDEIRSYGATSVQVMRRMNALVSDLQAAVPPERRAALRHWDERLDHSIDRHFAEAEEKREASAEDRQGFGASRPRHAA
jgi:uncharacterized membrane protein